jgi:hypothetical protein
MTVDIAGDSVMLAVFIRHEAIGTGRAISVRTSFARCGFCPAQKNQTTQAMKTIPSNFFRPLAVTVGLVCGMTLHAAPLTWFSGPALDTPMSGAATVVSGGNNILTGGDAYLNYDFPVSYPISLAATNAYWNFLPPFYSLNLAPGAVVSDGNIVIYGGSDGTNSQSLAFAYNLTGDTVPTLHSMNVARSYLGYAPDRNGNAYAFGGLDENGSALASAEKLNPTVNNANWTFIASLPVPRYNFPAVFNRTNFIYIFGGRTNATAGNETASVLRYSVSGNSWSNLAAMPVAVAGSAATLGPDGKIYVCGGTSGGVATSVVQVYNPVSNSWTISTPLPEAVTGAAAGVDSLGRLIVMGGVDINGNDLADVWRSQQLNAPDTIPGFIAYPSLVVKFLVPYVSSINATGNPQPTYQLVSGPTGMAVDSQTGGITWTPQASQIGTNTITVAASNFAGATNYTYNLVIARPPPSPITNLVATNITEFSATISWAPQDPVVGPVTYGFYTRHVTHSPRGSGSTVTYTLDFSSTNTSLTIFGLTPNTSTLYYVLATGVSGVSGYAPVSFTTPGPQPPVNFRMTGLTSTSITLAWDPSNAPVVTPRFEIWGWINNGVNSTSYGTNFTGTTATITGLTPGTQHQWGIRAFDAAGYVSGFNYGFTAVNPAPQPAQLSSAVSAGGGFQFTASLGNLQTVQIQAATNPGAAGAWQTIATFLPTNNPFTFTDPNAAQFPTRYYRIITP